jgi:hypothetical protein
VLRRAVGHAAQDVLVPHDLLRLLQRVLRLLLVVW